MAFISYAQNYEDVILYRALKHIEKGFYIDVGANDPVVDSVTKAFYDRGWRGINIEPARQWYDKLIADRPKDTNLNIAISDEVGVSELYDISDTGLSTLHKDIANTHLERSGVLHSKTPVPVLSLDMVLEQYPIDEIHFLKVDVEGSEKQVLSSIDLTHTRPWIILAEATLPESRTESHQSWEHILLKYNYLFVYFDGLNRFYLANEKVGLKSAFNTPPNIFDGFIRLREWNTHVELQTKEAKRRELEIALGEKEAKRRELELIQYKHDVEMRILSSALESQGAELKASQAALCTKDIEQKEIQNEQNRSRVEQTKVMQQFAKIITTNHQQLEEKEQTVSQLKTLLNESEQDRVARLGVIKEQEKALTAFRAHYERTSRIIRIAKWLKQWFLPKLGTFRQYPPRDLKRHYFLPKRPVSQTSFTIVIPSLNQAHFLEKTLLSVLKQNHTELEIVVQDGASTDGSVKILQRYAENLTNWRSEEDKGQSHALNMAFKGTTGDIMAYINSDDLLMPGTLNIVAHFFDTHPNVDVVYGHRILIDETENEIGRWVLPPHDDDVLLWVDYIPQETLFWRRQIWERVGGQFDESLQFAMDWDLLLRFQKVGAKFERLPCFLGAFRVHNQQKSSLLLEEVGWKEMDQLRQKYIGRVVTQQEIAAKTRRYMRWHVVYHKLFRIGIMI